MTGGTRNLSGAARPTHRQQWWRDMIEQRAYRRLVELRQRGLWDGEPPVPVDHVAEHLLRLSFSWEALDEHPDEVIYGCLRPETRELVLNERHYERFEENRGMRNFTVGHECGHADVFALADQATDQLALFAKTTYRPRAKSAPKGPVLVLGVQLAERLRGLPPEVRTEVIHRIHRDEQRLIEAGRDTALERRTVDRYAAALLMPRDVVTAVVRGRDLTRWAEIRACGARFEVSTEAFRIRLEELGFIHGVEGGRILLTDPTQEDQATLF